MSLPLSPVISSSPEVPLIVSLLLVPVILFKTAGAACG
jgi:hypothetical protein